MANDDSTLIALEEKFWQAMVDGDPDTATQLLDEPAVMVSAHGALQFDRRQYKEMAEQGPMVVKGFEFGDMQVLYPNDDMAVLTYRVKQVIGPRGNEGQQIEQHMSDASVWLRKEGQWRCVMHTETELLPQDPQKQG